MSMIDVTLMNKRINELDRELDYSAPIFGVYWDKNAPTELTRTHDAQGMVANVGVDGEWVQNDFDSAPIFGQIGDAIDDYGNEFSRVPKLYIRKTDGDGFKTFAVTTRPLPGFYRPHCFWDFERDKELPFIDVGKYKASLSADGLLESKAGVHPLVERNIVQFRDYAQANGKGYQLLDIHTYDVLRTLFLIEFANLDSQAIMRGWVDGQYSSSHTATVAETGVNRVILDSSHANGYEVGQSMGIGVNHYSNSVTGSSRTITSIESYDDSNTAIYFDGDPVDIAVGDVVANRAWMTGFSKGIAASSGSLVSNTDGKHPFVYRGIENLYGDLYQFVDGVNIDNHQAWVTANAEDYQSNVFAHPYERLGYVNAESNGYVDVMGFDPNHPYAEFPVSSGGSSSTYYADYYYQNTGQRIARVGGNWSHGAQYGVSFWYLNISSGSSRASIGGRLLKKPS